MARPSAGRSEYACFCTKRALATGIRNAHEPIMIGKAAVGVHAEQADRIMQGAYMPMPSVISAPRTKLPARPSDELHALQVERAAVACRRRPGCATRTAPAATSSAKPIPIWIVPLRPARDDAGAEPRAGDGGGDHQDQRRHVDLDRDGVDERLRDRRQRVTDVQRAGNQAIRHHLEKLEDGGRRRERADAERVEEIRDEADAEVRRRRSADGARLDGLGVG